MTDRVASDHPTVDTYRVTVRRHGGPNGRAVELDCPDHPADGDHIVLDGATRYAAVAGDRLLGVYPSPAMARDRAVEADELPGWLERIDRGPDRSLALDVIESGFLYGLRAPGESVVYEAVERPDESLSSIAEQFRDE
jgi:hypothetical protein